MAGQQRTARTSATTAEAFCCRAPLKKVRPIPRRTAKRNCLERQNNDQPGREAIALAHYQVAARDPLVQLYDAGQPLEAVRGGIHFNGAGHDLLGDAAARALLDAIGIPPATDITRGSAGPDILTGSRDADRLYGGHGADRLHGLGGHDVLAGADGRDRLYGHGGADLLTGGPGADRLHGGAGRDRLFGDAGNDTLVGGPGVDTLTGGAGYDTFVVDRLDVIVDLRPGDVVIYL